MKEIVKMFNECEDMVQVFCFGFLVIMGFTAWVFFCYGAPQWLVGTMALPMCFVIFDWCGRVKREMEKKAEADRLNEYEESCRQMREETAAIRNAQGK